MFLLFEMLLPSNTCLLTPWLHQEALKCHLLSEPSSGHLSSLLYFILLSTHHTLINYRMDLLILLLPLSPFSPSLRYVSHQDRNFHLLLQESGYYGIEDSILFIFGHATWHVGSLFCDQGPNPCLLHWKCKVLTTGPPGKLLICFFSAVSPVPRIVQ